MFHPRTETLLAQMLLNAIAGTRIDDQGQQENQITLKNDLANHLLPDDRDLKGI